MRRNVKGLVGVVVAMVAGFAAAAVPADNMTIYGTNVWQGATSGGEWQDAANWRAVNAGDNTAADLLTKNCVYDIGSLEDGAIISNQTADLKIAGLVTRSASSQGNITLAGEKALLTGKTVLGVNHAGTRVI